MDVLFYNNIKTIIITLEYKSLVINIYFKIQNT